MGPVLPVRLVGVDQAQPGFMDERGGLQGVAGVFAAQVLAGDAPQFGVDEGRQAFEGLFVASAPGLEQGGDAFVHLPFSSACQFRTTVMGVLRPAPADSRTRKRCPSALTSNPHAQGAVKSGEGRQRLGGAASVHGHGDDYLLARHIEEFFAVVTPDRKSGGTSPESREACHLPSPNDSGPEPEFTTFRT